MRNKWREVIRKEIEDWTKRSVLEYMEMKNKPTDRKFVFKVKRNRVFRARLCALGYVEIPSIDHQDNFAPVVMDTTNQLMLIYMI